jgi:hypothetical protein
MASSIQPKQQSEAKYDLKAMLDLRKKPFDAYDKKRTWTQMKSVPKEIRVPAPWPPKSKL